MNIPENVWTSKSGNDFLALYSAKGQLLGYIDQNGVPQGSLAGGSGVAPQIASVRISNSQLLNMSTVPVIIIPSPGPGKYISSQAISVQLDVGTIPFQISNSGAGNTYLYWAGFSPTTLNAILYFADTSANEGMDYTNASSQIFIYPSLMLNSLSLSDVLNQPLVMSMDDALSAGNGTMQVVVSYTIVTA